jgi:hypothetical protein
MTPEPSQTPVKTLQASETPASLATQTPNPTLATTCPTSPTGQPDCSSSAQATTSLSSSIDLEPGLNPATTSAELIDPSGQVLVNAHFNPDRTFSLTAPTGNYILRISAPGHLSVQKSISLIAGKPIDISATILPAGDINADNRIDALDLISLGAAYDTRSPQPTTADLNGDGFVDLFDLTLLARNWRDIGPITP